MHMTEADRLVTAGPDLPNPMSSVQTVLYDGDVYVVGGLGDAYDGEILKLEGNTWVTVANTGYNGVRVLSNPLIISGDQIDCEWKYWWLQNIPPNCGDTDCPSFT